MPSSPPYAQSAFVQLICIEDGSFFSEGRGNGAIGNGAIGNGAIGNGAIDDSASPTSCAMGNRCSLMLIGIGLREVNLLP